MRIIMKITFVLENINIPDSPEGKLRTVLEKHIPPSSLKGHENSEGSWVCTLEDNTNTFFVMDESSKIYFRVDEEKRMELFTYNAETSSIQNINLENLELFDLKRQTEERAAMPVEEQLPSDEDKEVAEIFRGAGFAELRQDTTPNPLRNVGERPATPYNLFSAQAPGMLRQGKPGEANDFKSLLDPVITAVKNYNPTGFSIRGARASLNTKKEIKDNLLSVLEAIKNNTSIRAEDLLTLEQKNFVINTGPYGGNLYKLIENTLLEQSGVETIFTVPQESLTKQFLAQVMTEQKTLMLEAQKVHHV